MEKILVCPEEELSVLVHRPDGKCQPSLKVLVMFFKRRVHRFRSDTGPVSVIPGTSWLMLLRGPDVEAGRVVVGEEDLSGPQIQANHTFARCPKWREHSPWPSPLSTNVAQTGSWDQSRDLWLWTDFSVSDSLLTSVFFFSCSAGGKSRGIHQPVRLHHRTGQTVQEETVRHVFLGFFVCHAVKVGLAGEKKNKNHSQYLCLQSIILPLTTSSLSVRVKLPQHTAHIQLSQRPRDVVKWDFLSLGLWSRCKCALKTVKVSLKQVNASSVRLRSVKPPAQRQLLKKKKNADRTDEIFIQCH